MIVLLQAAQQGDLFSLLLSMLIIAIPFLYITRMTSEARRRSQARPRREEDPDADLRAHGAEEAEEYEHAHEEAAHDEEQEGGARRAPKRRRGFSREHPYAEIEAERRTPQQLFREALRRTQPRPPKEQRAGEREAAARAERARREAAEKDTPKIAKEQLTYTEGQPRPQPQRARRETAETGLNRVTRLPQLQQAILWSEILGSPKGLSEDERER